MVIRARNTLQYVTGGSDKLAGYVSNWERNKGTVPIKKLRKLCVIYQIDRNELLGILVEDYKDSVRKAL